MSEITITSPLRRPSLPRTVLAVDAVVTALNGAAYVVAAEPLGELLGRSPVLLQGTGSFLLAFAMLLGVAALQDRPPRALVTGIVAVNALWAIDSVVVAAAGWGSPTTGATVWIALQGLVVGALAAAQALAVRRERPDR